MKYPRRIIKLIADGFVLDDNRQWVPIGYMRHKEDELLKHLTAGEVLYGKTWIPIAQAKAQQR